MRSITISNSILISAPILVLIVLYAFTFQEMEGHPAEKPQQEEMTPEEAFEVMMQVLTHKRCINCHPDGDRPLQGEDSHFHHLGVVRGPDGHGLPAYQCNSCHQDRNNNFSGVPGAPHWHLAPKSMAWEGLSPGEIAHSMTDPERNGGRTIEEVEHHLTADPLVMWAFEPGLDQEGKPREKPPVERGDYILAVKRWVASGAVIPE